MREVKKFLHDEGYMDVEESVWTITKPELIYLLNAFSGKQNKEMIEENKSIKKAYADFTNQILKADASQTIQGLQVTILASLKGADKLNE